MKELRWFWKAALLSAFVMINQGCQTARWVDSGPPFRDAASADVVLRFGRWDYIAISQPDYREDGFIRHLKREELGQTFDGLGLRRDTAVVVLGWTYQEEMLARVVAEWKTVLQQCGFRRVVCLRGSGDSNINGLPVLDDTNSSTLTAKHSASL